MKVNEGLVYEKFESVRSKVGDVREVGVTRSVVLEELCISSVEQCQLRQLKRDFKVKNLVNDETQKI